MYGSITSLEIFRWGFAHLPGAIFYYAKELELDTEDIGLLATLFYAFENIKPLFQSGVSAGQVLKCCPAYTNNKLSKRLSMLAAKQIIGLSEGQSKTFSDKIIHLEPLMDKLEQLIVRDHPQLMLFHPGKPVETAPEEPRQDYIHEQYQERINALERELAVAQSAAQNNAAIEFSEALADGKQEENFRKVADFISKKTGNLISVKMSNEVKKWLIHMGFTPDFLLIMLELCFERKITSPLEITRIAGDLHKYAVGSVEGLNLYFKNYIDNEKDFHSRYKQFDPEIADFGHFIGVDMNAEARKRLYYKWRFEWKMERDVIMKAGELMCQRTSNGGLEYIDHVLFDWMNKGLKTVPEVENEIAAFKKSRKEKPRSSDNRTGTTKSPLPRGDDQYSVYVPPEILAGLKKTTVTK